MESAGTAKTRKSTGTEREGETEKRGLFLLWKSIAGTLESRGVESRTLSRARMLT